MCSLRDREARVTSSVLALSLVEGCFWAYLLCGTSSLPCMRLLWVWQPESPRQEDRLRQEIRACQVGWARGYDLSIIEIQKICAQGLHLEPIRKCYL